VAVNRKLTAAAVADCCVHGRPRIRNAWITVTDIQNTASLYVTILGLRVGANSGTLRLLVFNVLNNSRAAAGMDDRGVAKAEICKFNTPPQELPFCGRNRSYLIQSSDNTLTSHAHTYSPPLTLWGVQYFECVGNKHVYCSVSQTI